MDNELKITELDVENVFRDKNIKLHDITKVVSTQFDIVIHEYSIETGISYNSELVKMYWHESILKYIEKFKLKPCPFCGSKVSIAKRNLESSDSNNYDVICSSENCYLEEGADWFLPEKTLIKMWNKRT